MPMRASGSRTCDVRDILMRRSVPILPDPMMATFTRAKRRPPSVCGQVYPNRGRLGAEELSNGR